MSLNKHILNANQELSRTLKILATDTASVWDVFPEGKPPGSHVADDYLGLDYLLTSQGELCSLKGLLAACGQAALAGCLQEHNKWDKLK